MRREFVCVSCGATTSKQLNDVDNHAAVRCLPCDIDYLRARVADLEQYQVAACDDLSVAWKRIDELKADIDEVRAAEAEANRQAKEVMARVSDCECEWLRAVVDAVKEYRVWCDDESIPVTDARHKMWRALDGCPVVTVAMQCPHCDDVQAIEGKCPNCGRNCTPIGQPETVVEGDDQDLADILVDIMGMFGVSLSASDPWSLCKLRLEPAAELWNEHCAAPPEGKPSCYG